MKLLPVDALHTKNIAQTLAEPTKERLRICVLLPTTSLLLIIRTTHRAGPDPLHDGRVNKPYVSLLRVTTLLKCGSRRLATGKLSLFGVP